MIWAGFQRPVAKRDQAVPIGLKKVLKSSSGAGAGLSWRKFDLPLCFIVLVSVVLRMTNLAYSHFQGDEIKALFPEDAVFPDFLLNQRRGPGQFIVTLGVRLVTGRYEEWITRIPFALSSSASVLVIYYLTREHWGRSPALLAAALVGTCGLLVAFGRIVQYQSFCILFVVLTAYFMLKALRSDSPTPIYIGFLFYALALLTHYDALTFAPTLCFLAAANCWSHPDQRRWRVAHWVAASLIALSIAAVFYVPYMQQSQFLEVRPYLIGRVIAGRGLETFSDIHALLGLYLPPYYLLFTAPFLSLGIVSLLCKRRDVPSFALVLWFVTAFSFYMFLGGDPRSHIYNYFIPGLVITAYGIHVTVEFAASPRVRRLLLTSVWLVVFGFACLVFYMLVDHAIEHPWYRKTIFGYPLPNLEERQIEGVFGFPYQRGLETVGALFDSGQLKGTFDSNERSAMADYYFHGRRGSPPDYYIYVHRPLSLERELPAFVTDRYRRIREISVGGRKTIEIYESLSRQVH